MADSAFPATPSLRAAGMRQTPQREGILRVLKDSDRPLTVEEIWERMPAARKEGDAEARDSGMAPGWQIRAPWMACSAGP